MGRRNEKYRTRLNKKTANPGFEKVIAFQTIICAILLVAGIVLLFVNVYVGLAVLLFVIVFQNLTYMKKKKDIDKCILT